MTKVLLVAALGAAIVVGGAWAFFLRSSDTGHPIQVGALEDAVKQVDPAVADQRVALASSAGFDALGITTRRRPARPSRTRTS